MTKFEKGKVYMGGLAYGKDAQGMMQLVSRTDKYVTVMDITLIEQKRCKVSVRDGVECIQFDCITVFRADRVA